MRSGHLAWKDIRDKVYPLNALQVPRLQAQLYALRYPGIASESMPPILRLQRLPHSARRTHCDSPVIVIYRHSTAAEPW